MNWTLYRLESNFRCASAICACANALMSHQRGRVQKQTVSATDQTGHVRIVEAGFETDDAEAHAVAEDILHHVNKARHVEDFVTPNQCAVLVRTNYLVDFFRANLKCHGLPICEKAKADLPTDWQRAKAALALLANPDNDRLAYVALSLSAGRQKADEVRRRALEEYRTINDTALFLPTGFLAGQALDQLAKMNVSRDSLERIGKVASLLPPDSPVADLVLAVGREAVDEVEGDGIAVKTLHGAKGGEWQAVWLPAWEAETLPGCRQDTDIEEARRLAYVGITRAKSYVWISWAKRRASQWGPAKDMTVSQFVKECGE